MLQSDWKISSVCTARLPSIAADHKRVYGYRPAVIDNDGVDVRFRHDVAQRVHNRREPRCRFAEAVDVDGRAAAHTVEKRPQLHSIDTAASMDCIEWWQCELHIANRLCEYTAESHQHDGTELRINSRAEKHINTPSYHWGN